jgi:hypothetical protein
MKVRAPTVQVQVDWDTACTCTPGTSSELNDAVYGTSSSTVVWLANKYLYSPSTITSSTMLVQVQVLVLIFQEHFSCALRRRRDTKNNTSTCLLVKVQVLVPAKVTSDDKWQQIWWEVTSYNKCQQVTTSDNKWQQICCNHNGQHFKKSRWALFDFWLFSITFSSVL